MSVPADFYLADSNGHYFEETSTSFSMQTRLDQGFSILACAPGETSDCTTLSTYAPASSWCGKTTCPKGTHWCGADEGCLSACD